MLSPVFGTFLVRGKQRMVFATVIVAQGEHIPSFSIAGEGCLIEPFSVGEKLHEIRHLRFFIEVQKYLN